MGRDIAHDSPKHAELPRQRTLRNVQGVMVALEAKIGPVLRVEAASLHDARPRRRQRVTSRSALVLKVTEKCHAEHRVTPSPFVPRGQQQRKQMLTRSLHLPSESHRTPDV